MTTTTATETAAAFQIGQDLSRASAGDSDCIFRFTVIARTAKFVTLAVAGYPAETYRVGIKVDEHGEWCLPFGSYSMAPTLHAAQSAR